MSVSFDGPGKLPNSLSLRILLVQEGDRDKEAAIANATLFELERMANE